MRRKDNLGLLPPMSRLLGTGDLSKDLDCVSRANGEEDQYDVCVVCRVW